MHMLDQVGRIEHRRLAAAGRPAADLDGGDRWRIRQDDRRSAQRQPVLGIADLDASHIGDEIARAGCDVIALTRQGRTCARHACRCAIR